MVHVCGFCVLTACCVCVCMHVCVLCLVADFVLRLTTGPEGCDEKGGGGDICGRPQAQTERRVRNMETNMST